MTRRPFGSAANHPGDLIIEPAYVVVEVATDRPPDTGTFTSVAEGALAGNVVGAVLGIGAGLVDVLVGWYQAIDTIDATAEIQMTHHRFNPGLWHGSIAITDSLHQSSYVRDEITKEGSNVPGWRAESITETSTRQDKTEIREVQSSFANPDGNEAANLIGRDRARVEYVIDTKTAQERYDVSGCWSEDASHSRNYVYGYVSDEAVISMDIRQLRYTIGIEPPEIVARGTGTFQAGWKKHGGCSYAGKTEDFQISSDELEMFFGDPLPDIEGEIDPNSPNRLHGSKIVTLNQRTITYVWDLRRDPS